jgi:glycosyltransferase involved in cell wall biosynthesis
MSEPLATFLVPAYNAMPHIVETVKSIQSQTESNFFAIIINDGSTDGTEDFLHQLCDERFTVIHRPNSGYVDALNFGAEQVQTKYIARLDADDISLPERLSKQLHFLEIHADVAVVGSRNGYIAGKRQQFRVGLGSYAICPSYAPPMARPPLWNPSEDGQTITHSTATIRTDAFRSVGGYRPLAPAEDLDLWLRLHDVGYKLACLDEILALYRVGSTSVSSLSYNRQIQTIRYARFCHECRVAHRPEPDFDAFVSLNPLSSSDLDSAKTRLQLRMVMGRLLSGQLARGSAGLLRLLVEHPGELFRKIEARCS